MTTRRDIVNQLRTRDHKAYMLHVAGPMDSILCPACYAKAGPRTISELGEPLTVSDLCAIGHAEQWAEQFVCDSCGADLLA